MAASEYLLAIEQRPPVMSNLIQFGNSVQEYP